MTLFTDKVSNYLPRLMQDLQITRIQACGIFGNIGTETGGFTALQEKKPVAGRGGYGWMQWTGPRRKAYEAWCKTSNLDPAADETNYKYLVQETLGAEKHSLDQLKKTTTLEAATETFMVQNLRPGKPNLQDRIKWAHTAYDVAAPEAKDNKVTTTTATTILVGTGAAVATAAHPHNWWYIGLAVIAALVIGVVSVHLFHKAEEKQAKGLN